MSKIKPFLKQKKVKVIILIICITFGGVSTAVSFVGAISTLLYIIALVLAVQLSFEWRDFKEGKE